MRLFEAAVRPSIFAWLILLGLGPRSFAQIPCDTYSTCGRWTAITDCPSPPGADCPNGGWPNGLQAVHAIQATTGDPLIGKLLLYRSTVAGSSSRWNAGALAHFWNPKTGLDTLLLSSNADEDLFCSGHVVGRDGKVLVFGGTDKTYLPTTAGLRTTYFFDPRASTQTCCNEPLPRLPWTRRSELMTDRRWYPTQTVLADGRVLTVSGITIQPGQSNLPERYDYNAFTWTSLTSAAPYDSMTLYPFMFVVPDSAGTVVHVGPKFKNGRIEKMVNPDLASPSWADFAASSLHGASAVMYDKGKVLKSGGRPPGTNPDTVMVKTGAEVISLLTSQVTATGNMNRRRHYHNLTVLPNGRVLATGGAIRARGGVPWCSEAVYETEIWNPGDGTWTLVAPMTHRDPDMPRLYHSTALLLPDGRILSAGGECYTPGPDPDICPGHSSQYCTSGDFFEPPYLFNASNVRIDDTTDRPQVSSIPVLVATGSTFTVTATPGSGTSLGAASFIRPAAVTHGYDQDQRFVPLTYTSNGNTRTVTAPSMAEEAPPGYYMLFFVNDLGYPSTGRLVEVWGTPQASIAHSNFSNNPGNFEVDIGWKTNRLAPGTDQVLFYRRSGPTGPFDPPIAATCVSGCTNTGFVHSGRWRISPCNAGYWYYEVKSSTTGTVTTSTSQKRFLVKILNCLDE